jgi:hypothetical protein
VPASGPSAPPGRRRVAGGSSGGTGALANAEMPTGNSGALPGTTAGHGGPAAHAYAPPPRRGSTRSGNSGSAPGRVKQTAAPATTTTTSTAPGSSGSAPGRTSPHGNRYANGG